MWDGGGCGGVLAVSVSRTTLAAVAALRTIWLATRPPSLDACKFNSIFLKGSPPLGSPKAEDGFGTLVVFLGGLALA